MSAWPAISASMRRALLGRGWAEGEIDETLSALRPIVVAVERAGTRVDEDVAWALLACEADRRRRRAQVRATARS